jgi:hypothetical protein
MAIKVLRLAEKQLTKNQIRGFWASWIGLALDGMDSFLYALVLVPGSNRIAGKPDTPERLVPHSWSFSPLNSARVRFV